MTQKDFSSVTARLQKALDQTGGGSSLSEGVAHLRSVQMQIEAIEEGDFEAVLAQALPDVTLDIFAPPEFDWIRHARGVSELRRALEQNFASVVDQQPEIMNVFAEGDTVVLFGRERGRLRATGDPYDVEFVEKFTFRDNRLTAVRIIAAHAAARSRST
jgi:ketosteroid isomerase-like protein